jgi:hypothetical protein
MEMTCLEHEATAGYNDCRRALEEVTYNGHSWLQGSARASWERGIGVSRSTSR